MALGKGLGSLIPSSKSNIFIQKETVLPVAKPGETVNKFDRIWHIPVTEIVPNTEQPRRFFAPDELDDLANSIAEHGVLQPITVMEKEDGGYEIIAGERRFRASQKAGLSTVPAIVKSVSGQEKLELALIENIQRQNLNPIEEAFAYRRLIEQFYLTQEQVAKKVGKSRPVIANTIRLLDLPDKIQNALMDGSLSSGKAKAILSLRSSEEQLAAFESMMGTHMTVRDIEHAVMQKGALARKGALKRDPNVLAQEQLLEERFGVKARISQRGERGVISFEYYSKEELKRILGEMLNG
jgi:ParB family chromosome partitioning protein